MNFVSARVLEHYCRHWGEPDRAAQFSRDERSLRVFKWLPDQTHEGVTIYATAGVSEVPVGAASPEHRVELLLGFNPEDDRIAGPLATLALSSPTDDPHLLHGHTVTYPHPLITGLPFSSFLVMRPTVPIIGDLAVDGLHVLFLHAVPLYPTELAFKKRRSAEDLLELWERHQRPFWDPGRSALPGDA